MARHENRLEKSCEDDAYEVIVLFDDFAFDPHAAFGRL